MYALLTQLLDIPNYQVVSAEIGTDKITLDIEGISIAFPIRSLDRHLRQRHALTVAKPQKRCTKDTPAGISIALPVQSLDRSRPPYQRQADLSPLCQTSILL